MPDFTPDTSIYKPQNQMDFGSILGLVQRMRELNTQSGIAEAIRANPNDPTAAYSAAAKNPNVMMGPGDVGNFISAQQAKAHLGEYYNQQVAKGLIGLWNNPKPTEKDFNRFVTIASPYIDSNFLKNAHDNIVRNDGTLDKDRIADFYGQITGGADIATRNVNTPYGTQQVPAGRALYGDAGGGTPTSAPRPATAPQAPSVQPNDTAQQSLDAVRKQRPAYGVTGGGVTTSTNQQQETALQGSAAQYVRDQAQDYQSGVIPLTKSIELMLKNGPSFTGRGTTEINNIKNFLHTIGIIPDNEMDKVVDFESMKKYMENFINNNSAGGTDARLWQSIAGSPSPDKLQQTNLNLSRVMLGLARMKQVGLDEFKRVGGQPGDWQSWYNDWAKRQDPMAFVWDTMTAEEQKAYGAEHWKGQKKGSSVLQRFQDSLAAGQRSAGVMSQ